MMGTAQFADASLRRNSHETAAECRCTPHSEASRGNAVAKLNGVERAHRSAVVAARIAFLFDSKPAVQQARVYLSRGGFVMVRENVGKVPERLLGVYDRTVTVQQIVEDME